MKLPLKVRLTAATPGQSLEWEGGPPFIFRATHGFRIQSLADDRVRFVHYETFAGVATLLMGRVFRQLARDYERMNTALKDRVESVS